MPKSTEKKMKLLLDESGHVVVRNDKPVYTTSNGNEIEFDAGSVTDSNNNLKNKIDTLSENLRVKTVSLEAFEGIDPEKARRAIDDNLTHKDESTKYTELQASYDSLKQEKEKLSADYEEKETAFKHDVFLSGLKADFETSNERHKSTLTSEMSYLLFSPNFKNEEVDGKMVKVGYLNGEKIRSQETGKIASFEEAYQIMNDAHPDNKNWMKATDKGGSGAGGGESDANANRTETKLNGTRSERVKAIAERFPELE